MPLYEYRCEQCECTFELLRGFAHADDAAVCPNCQRAGARRLLSKVAAISRAADGASGNGGAGTSCASCAASSCAGCRQ